MHSIKVLLTTTILALSSVVSADNTIDLFGNTGCNNYQTTEFVGNAQDGGCVSLGNSRQSVRVTGLNPGCTVTVYADSTCSTNALAARVGECISSGRGITALTVDNC